VGASGNRLPPESMTEASSAFSTSAALLAEAPHRSELLTQMRNLLKASQTPPPTTLFHYTSPSSLLSILGSRALWATHVRFLNDQREFSYALDQVVNALRELEVSDADARRRATITELLSHVRSLHSTDVFVISLSESGDTLSQWRAYCPRTGGFAIGFARQALELAGNRSSYVLVQCIYDTLEQERILSELLQSLISYVIGAEDRGLHPSTDLPIVREVMFAGLLSVVAPTFKHPSFREEVEWRLISAPSVAANLPVRYRPGKFTLVPYQEIAFASSASPPPVVDVVIGPTPYPEASAESLRAYLSTLQLSPAVARHSTTPYRDW
jgi:hypothetical protein